MRRLHVFLPVLVLALVAVAGCPPQGPPTSESVDIGASGGIVRAGGGSLSIPPGSILNTTKVTLEQNKAGVSVQTTASEMPVSDVFSVTQDAGLLQAKGDTRLLLTLPYNSSSFSTKANTNANVYAIVNTPDGVVRIFGTLVDGTIELSLGGLLASADFQVVHNPNMVVAPGGASATRARAKLTNPPPWASSTWLIAYDPSDSTIIDVTAQLSGKPESAVTDADVATHVRDALAAEAQSATGYFVARQFRQPNLGMKSIAGAGTGFIVDALTLGGSHYSPGILGSYGELYIAVDRLLDPPSDVLGTITQTVTHEMFHAIVDGYELEGQPNGNASSFRGHNEGLAQVLGHTRDTGAITVRANETMFLNLRLGIDSDSDAYRNGDFYAYVAKRFGGGALDYVGGVNQGVLEQVRLWVEDQDPSTTAASYITYLQGINNSFGGQFGSTLNEVYWDFAKNRAYEHNDESRLRAGDAMPRFSLARNRFIDAGIVMRTIAEPDASVDVSLPSMPTLSTVVIELIAGDIDSDLTITMNTQGIVPDGLGNSLRAKAYLEGMDGAELSLNTPEATLSGFGNDGAPRAYIVVSNVSDEKFFAPSFTITSMPNLEQTGTVTGRVVDAENGDPVAGVNVTASTEEKALLDVSATTDANGQFTLAELPPGVIILGFAADGYLATEQTVTVIADETVQIDVSLIVRDSGEPMGDASGRIIDAVTGLPIEGVLVELHPDIVSNTSGAAAAMTTTDGAGMYAFNALDAGVYTAFLSAEGYEANVLVIYVVGGEASGGQDGELVPELTEGEVRIVLTWGATPSDLDSHLTAPTPDAARFHLYWGNNGTHPYVALYDLDLDDQSGFGPETITLHGLIAGTYRYSVHNYSNRASDDSVALSNSGAQVRVFFPGGVETFNVSPGTPGTVWTVFEIDGETGNLSLINEYFFEEDSDNAGSFKNVGAEAPNQFHVSEK